jgi:hypothetical protein
MTFYETVLLCAKTPEFVQQFDRLTSSNLSFKGSILDQLIDEATGKQSEEIESFIDFVYSTVWLPLQQKSVDC